MLTHTDVERRMALVELLSRADPPDIRRGHRRVLEGHPERHKQIAQIVSAYVQRHLLEIREREALRNRQPEMASGTGVQAEGWTVAFWRPWRTLERWGG